MDEHHRARFHAPLRPPFRWAARGLPLMLAALVACSGGEGDGEEVELPVENGNGHVVEPGDGVVGKGPSRADSMTATVSIEGMDEPLVFRLYRSSSRFPLSFSTYLPDPFRPMPGGRDTVRFGMGSGAAVFEIVSLPEGTSEEEARRKARRVVGTGGEVETRPLMPGALLTLLGSTDGRTARADLLRRGDRYVILALRYPPEYGDGIGPRVEAIREAWVWTEDETPLIGPVARDVPVAGTPVTDPPVADTTGA